MRLLIDLQGAQSDSRFRGIGRYSLSLARAVAARAHDHDVWILLNGALSDNILELREAFAPLVRPGRVRVMDVPAPLAEHDAGSSWRARAAELVREHAIAQLWPEAVLVTSLFEGYVDDAVTSVHLLDTGTPTAVVLYDLIPLLNRADYLSDPAIAAYYGRKLDSLRRADLLLAISDHTRSEAVQTLGVDSSRVVNISTAIEPDFGRSEPAPQDVSALLQRLGITRPFVMTAPGGFDARKNVTGLITAFALLPARLREEHQLVVTSKATGPERAMIQDHVRSLGLPTEAVVFTGYVGDDDLAALYGACEVFVIPSLHEGFGLPALEAMTCGAAVLGSDATSIPEVVPWAEAQFDPAVPESISDRLRSVLEDPELRAELRARGEVQARSFSWEQTAARAVEAIESHLEQRRTAPVDAPGRRRRRLALVTPMPPDRTGIAGYSADLLPALATHYDVVVVTSSTSPAPDGATVRSHAWFEQHGDEFDRIVYQVGNSPFHTAMFALLPRFPGVVVLHDFFLSGVLSHEEFTGVLPRGWHEALFASHGYAALQHRALADDESGPRSAWPSNLPVLQAATAVIVHSEHARELAEQWYGPGSSDDWTVVPLVRTPAAEPDRAAARQVLGLPPETFLVCCFGMVDATKQTLRLVRALLSSSLARDPNCRLVLVGENHGGDYGKQVLEEVASATQGQVQVTGWVDSSRYRAYLDAADLAVQLRTDSRGETSAAVLDCLNHGAPTIVNANGSMQDLPAEAVLKLRDNFDDDELRTALETLHGDPGGRRELALAGRRLVNTQHSPAHCARAYVDVIESTVPRAGATLPRTLKRLAALPQLQQEDHRRGVAQCLALSTPPAPRPRQLMLDVSTLVRTDLRTGIERVVRAQTHQLLREQPPGVRVEPVYLDRTGDVPRYRYARRWTHGVLALPEPEGSEPVVDIHDGDVLFCPDYHPEGVLAAAEAGLYTHLRARGVRVAFAVYDLLPVLEPRFFPPDADVGHGLWLQCVAEHADVAVCISQAVADELQSWLAQAAGGVGGLRIVAALLGADLDATLPSKGLPPGAQDHAAQLAASPSFLMVGTVEPRKGHAQALDAFEVLWSRGHDVQLVIVGQEGWRALPDEQRRSIPALAGRLRSHPELGRRLHWLEGISDEHLEVVYGSAACLLAPSEGEGFGLPLIEAAQHGLPAIARDLPVFREVAGEHAQYFAGLGGEDLAETVLTWLGSHPAANSPATVDMPWRTWRQNVDEVVQYLLY